VSSSADHARPERWRRQPPPGVRAPARRSQIREKLSRISGRASRRARAATRASCAAAASRGFRSMALMPAGGGTAPAVPRAGGEAKKKSTGWAKGENDRQSRSCSED